LTQFQPLVEIVVECLLIPPSRYTIKVTPQTLRSCPHGRECSSEKRQFLAQPCEATGVFTKDMESNKDLR
jgi:hypothetical protein